MSSVDSGETNPSLLLENSLTESGATDENIHDALEVADILEEFQVSKKRKVLEPHTAPSARQPTEQTDKMIVEDDFNSNSQEGFHSRNSQSPFLSKLRYDESLKGECKIMIESLKHEKSAKDLNRLTYAKIFNDRYKNCIVDVKSSGFGKLAIFTNSACTASTILNDKSYLEGKGIKAFIPFYFVTSQGVIRGVPLDISEQEIKEGLDVLGFHHGNSVVLEVRRLSKKNI